MKRAESFEVGTRIFERNIPADHIGYVSLEADLFFCVVVKAGRVHGFFCQYVCCFWLFWGNFCINFYVKAIDGPVSYQDTSLRRNERIGFCRLLINLKKHLRHFGDWYSLRKQAWFQKKI